MLVDEATKYLVEDYQKLAKLDYRGMRLLMSALATLYPAVGRDIIEREVVRNVAGAPTRKQ